MSAGSSLRPEHRVRAYQHTAGPRCRVVGQHTYVVCSCGVSATVEFPDAISDWVRAHDRWATWYDHRGVPVHGFR